jgi:purine-binding chemotaxis protein CheW
MNHGPDEASEPAPTDAEFALLRRRAARLAARRDGCEQVDELELLTFQVGAERFALPVSALRGVVTVERFTRVPGAAVELFGVFYVRGEIVPLVDLGRIVGSPLQPNGPGRALLCRAPAQLALGVDEVLGIVHRSSHELRPTEASLTSPLIEALLPDNTALLRLEAVLAVPALLSPAQR